MLLLREPTSLPLFERVPSKTERLLVAGVIATATFALVFVSAIRGSGRTDFSLTWFGANALLHGANPYVLVGPGRVFDLEWGALYPATAYVIGIPFAALPEHIAAALFVALSSFALAYGSMRDSWHRLPMFASVAFLSSAHLAQWSILFTAALFTPSLAIAFPAKPQMAIAILAGSCTRRRMMLAAASFAGITILSLILTPGWPAEWLALVHGANQLTSPVMRPGGLLLLAVLLKWRNPEALLVAAMAVIPQTSYPYNFLPLLAVAATYREACFLSLTSSVGALASIYLTDAVGGETATNVASAVVIALCYMPAVFVVLSREPLGARKVAEARVRPIH